MVARAWSPTLIVRTSACVMMVHALLYPVLSHRPRLVLLGLPRGILGLLKAW